MKKRIDCNTRLPKLKSVDPLQKRFQALALIKGAVEEAAAGQFSIHWNNRTFESWLNGVEYALRILLDDDEAKAHWRELVSQVKFAPNASPDLQRIQNAPPFNRIVEWLRATYLACVESDNVAGRFDHKATVVGDRVFIGHGHSPIWRELKDFLHDSLKLEWEEFRREPTAGMHTVERLQQMLDAARFAFIVLTAEDEGMDGKVKARANAIHEAGLFQGRLGFRRAIIMLEDGCDEFSNIAGLTQIRFQKGNILSDSEEIRRTLKREGIIK